MRMRFACVVPTASIAVLVASCEPLPLTHDDPTSPCTSFEVTVKQSSLDKVDLLFMIDNSPSMGDKHAYFADSVAYVIGRLVQPSCVDDADPQKIVGRSDANGRCVTGHRELPPITDLHVGVITSSLGARGGDVCNATDMTPGGLSRHNDDRARLVSRGGADEHVIGDMQPSGFLSWFPDAPANANSRPSAGATPLRDSSTLEKDFRDLVAGVHERGCGIESPLESWYRFLVQPDPYDHIDAGDPALWVGIDHTIIQQRHDFLRPDSLVFVVSLSDENDSEIDVRSLGKQAYLWMRSDFQPPRGTEQCANTPADPACTSCKLAPNGGAGDSDCAKGAYSAPNDWGFDMNLRHVHMKQKYGIDLQFPIARYVQGLTQNNVPDRAGEYPAGRANYVGDAKCVNPLFAAALPDGSVTDPKALCNLRRGWRTRDLIFFAHIGGVPSRLVHFVPDDPVASTLTDADWLKILGKDIEQYDYSGIDPHMIESFGPRAGLAPPSSADDADKDHGREWVTNATGAVDLQYACTFALPSARDCSNPANAEICDCPSVAGGPHERLPPLCDPKDVTKQIRGKAYPTTRELLLARKLGTQGIVASICPVHTVEQGAGDPLYGYRAAFDVLFDRLHPGGDTGCLDAPVTMGADGKASCIVLEVLPSAVTICDSTRGLVDPDPALLRRFREQLRARTGGDGGADDPSTFTICQLAQLAPSDFVQGSCATSTAAGWCYVSGAAAGACPQALLFSPSGTPTSGVEISVQCSRGCGE